MKYLYKKANDTFKDVLQIYNNLSKDDQSLISSNQEFINSPYLITRKIKYINNEPVGFCEAYKYNGASANTASIVVAVLNKYRYYGIGSELVKNVVTDCYNRGYRSIIYECDSNNASAKDLALKLGFSITYKTKNTLTFKLDLSPYNNPYTSRLKRYIYPAFGQVPYSTYINGFGPKFWWQSYYPSNNYLNSPPDGLSNDIDNSSTTDFNESISDGFGESSDFGDFGGFSSFDSSGDSDGGE